jgi:hypothetical protein
MSWWVKSRSLSRYFLPLAIPVYVPSDWRCVGKYRYIQGHEQRSVEYDARVLWDCEADFTELWSRWGILQRSTMSWMFGWFYPFRHGRPFLTISWRGSRVSWRVSMAEAKKTWMRVESLNHRTQ